MRVLEGLIRIPLLMLPLVLELAWWLVVGVEPRVLDEIYNILERWWVGIVVVADSIIVVTEQTTRR